MVDTMNGLQLDGNFFCKHFKNFSCICNWLFVDYILLQNLSICLLNFKLEISIVSILWQQLVQILNLKKAAGIIRSMNSLTSIPHYYRSFYSGIRQKNNRYQRHRYSRLFLPVCRYFSCFNQCPFSVLFFTGNTVSSSLGWFSLCIKRETHSKNLSSTLNAVSFLRGLFFYKLFRKMPSPRNTHQFSQHSF